MAVVHALSSGTAKNAKLKHQLRCLHFFSAQYHICIKAKHVPGAHNLAADALSRNHLPVFFSCTPQAAKAPITCPRTADPTAGTAVPRLDIGRLKDNVSFYLGKALAPSMLRTYSSGQRHYVQFCTDAALQPWPLTERVLCLFVAHLGVEKLIAPDYQVLSVSDSLPQHHY